MRSIGSWPRTRVAPRISHNHISAHPEMHNGIAQHGHEYVHAGLSRRFVFPGWIRIGNPWVNSRCSLRIQVPHLEVAYGILGVFLTLLATPKVPTIDERQGARAAIAQRRNQF